MFRRWSDSQGSVKALQKLSYLIDEPYDPDARDGDGDGIVQEWTVWERPAGTRLIDKNGADIAKGSRVQSTALTARPQGMRVVDKDGNVVDYTPTYLPKPKEGTIGSAQSGAAPKRGTPLSDVGAGSINETGRQTVRAVARPAAMGIAAAAAVPSEPLRTLPVVPERESLGGPYSWRYIPGLVKRYADYPGYLEEHTDQVSDEMYVRLNSALDDVLMGMESVLLHGEDGPAFRAAVLDLKEMFGDLLPDAAILEEEIRRIRALSFEDSFSALLNFISSHIAQALDTDFIDSYVEVVNEDAAEYETRTPVIAVPLHAVKQVISEGRMKTQFETGTSMGSFDPEFRQGLERTSFGVPDNLPVELRPVYGFLPTIRRVIKWSDDGELELRDTDEAYMDDRTLQMYGDFALVLKPKVRNRTTYTFGDSFGTTGRGVGIPLNPDTVMSIAEQLNLRTPTGELDIDAAKSIMRMLGVAMKFEFDWIDRAFDRMVSRQPAARQQILRRLIAASGRQFQRTDWIRSWSGYVEAQVHGGVDMQDIDRIIVPYKTLEEIPAEVMEFLEIARKQGVAIQLSA